MNAKDEIAKLMAKLNKDRAKQMFKDAGIEVDDSVFVDKSEAENMTDKKPWTLKDYGDAMERRKNDLMDAKGNRIEELEAENLALNKYVDELLEEPRALKKRIRDLEAVAKNRLERIEELEEALKTWRAS